MTTLIPLVVILGPTAVGKTEIAIELAEHVAGEIVSADSRLFYRGMDIGTAKPSLTERMRVPHHLIDVTEPDKTWSLGIFQKEAKRTIQQIYERGHLPFLVGGTGQFVRATIEGWKIPPLQPNPQIRVVLDQWAMQIGKAELHARLSVLDPLAASSIDPSNVRRTIRALEVILSTGKRFSDQRTKGHKPYQTLLLGLNRPRAELYRRIDERISKMLEMGFVDEVRGLLEAGFPVELPTMSAIGYREIAEYLQGKMSLEKATVLMKRRTREFVRRQANWFKENDPEIIWFNVGQDTVKEMEGAITQWLESVHLPSPSLPAPSPTSD